MIAAIGDLHAYGKKLDEMLIALAEKINFIEDTVVFLGDYVDGGKDAKYVITRLMELQQTFPHWKFLMGNHEDLMLSGLQYCKSVCSPTIGQDFFLWYHQGGRQTAESYLGNVQYMPVELIRSQIPKDHLEWLRTLPLHYETRHFIFVHAGLRPHQPIERVGPLDKLWIREEFIDSTFDWGKRVIFGHTYRERPVVQKNKIGIDTMHHGGGHLTAVLLDNNNPTWYDFVRV